MERINLSDLCQRFRARVIHITPLDDCYLLETNRGSKELHVWPRIDVMRWSFHWRESMVRQGFRELDRFIRTRDSKPYVILGQRGFTLTDHQRHIESVIPSVETSYESGRIISLMHATHRDSALFHASDYWEREQTKAAGELKKAQDLLGTLRYRGRQSVQMQETYRWLFPPLLERMERRAELLGSTRVDETKLFVTHARLSQENWVTVQNKLYLRGLFKPTLSIALRDVATYLRELYLRHEDLAQVDAFLDGYEERSPLDQSDYTLVLAFMAEPKEVWNEIRSHFRENGKPEEERLAGIQQAVQAQQAVDVLMKQIAERAEGIRGESKS
ncbi:phosphotransferase [Brevibacillus ruminantium]|uniref:Phosphotransferase n=1 Tax=Brevibacillus ruminantium TaxID=2950604 RepID=A0ABY4WDD6_9BACL|nr:phosphotransferase [Brevibacillus ruminantium]USG64148.1 phosphotransferase [Brevibacillus ruminantium]